MTRKFSRALAATAAVAGLGGCASAPVEHHWVSVKPVHIAAQSDLAGVDGDYAAAVAAIDRRDYALALDLLQTANAQKGGDVRILNAFGVVYDKLGRFDLSGRYYARARAADANSPIVAANQAYSAALQGLNAQPAERAFAAAAPPAAVSPPAVWLAPADLAEAPRPANLAMATPVVFHSAQQPAIRSVAPPLDPAVHAPVYLPPAIAIAPAVTLTAAQVSEAPRAPALTLAKAEAARSAVRLAPAPALTRFAAPEAPQAPAQRFASAAVRPATLQSFELLVSPRAPEAPVMLATAARTITLAASPPIVLRAVTSTALGQPGVIRLAAISPGAVRTLPPARRGGVEIADASGRGGVGAPVRLQLARLGWTTPKGAIATVPRAARTTITYAAYRAPTALSLARTLPPGVRMVDCGTACGGIRLTLGADSLSWPGRFRAFIRSFG